MSEMQSISEHTRKSLIFDELVENFRHFIEFILMYFKIIGN